MSVNSFELVTPTEPPASNEMPDEMPAKFELPAAAETPPSIEDEDAKSHSSFGDPVTKKKGFADLVELHTIDARGTVIEVIPTSEFVLQENKKDTEELVAQEEHVVVLRRTWQKRRSVSRLIRLDLEIHSEILAQAFRKVAIDTHSSTRLHDEPLTLESPFSELFFYRHQIEEWATGEEIDPVLQEDAKVLYGFMRSNGLFSSIVRDYERFLKQDRVLCDILWTIYPPNSLLVVKNGEIEECWICRDVALTKRFNATFWTVRGLCLAMDGHQFKTVEKTCEIPMRAMEVYKLADLPVIPISFHKDSLALKERMTERARKVKEALGEDSSSFQLQAYSGPSFDRPWDRFGMGESPDPAATPMDDRVIVDVAGYRMQAPRMPPGCEIIDAGITVRPLEISTATALPRGFTASRRRAASRDNRGRPLPSRSRNKNRRGARVAYDPDSGSGSDSSDSDFDEDFDSDDEQLQQKVQAELDITKDQDFNGREPSEVRIETQNADDGGLTTLLKTISSIYHITEEYIEWIFPALLPAFCLKGKTWQLVLVDKLKDVDWNPNMFESLRIEDGTKNLVRSLVQGQKSTAPMFDDLVRGKGQGLVFLLHGKPGLGKTLTAESIAEYLKRPLYSISSGEVGVNSHPVEINLDRIFNMTKRWNAVLLLDEADVLLCKREVAHMDRNAVVGVFLRKIEYFQGVLFLTTNRKQDFDEAFKSRIHVTISYPDLSRDDQSSIWESLIATNKTRGLEVADDAWNRQIFRALGGFRFNGRTIKNMLRTAIAFANADKEPLAPRHVLAILQTELAESEASPEEQKANGTALKELRHLAGLID